VVQAKDHAGKEIVEREIQHSSGGAGKYKRHGADDR